MAVWLKMPFPYGSEFAWDSTGHEEISTWMLRFGRAREALGPERERAPELGLVEPLRLKLLDQIRLFLSLLRQLRCQRWPPNQRRTPCIRLPPRSWRQRFRRFPVCKGCRDNSTRCFPTRKFPRRKACTLLRTRIRPYW